MQTSFTISARESVRLSDLDIFDAVLNFERLSVEPASQYDTEKPLTNITEVFTLDENDAAMIVRYQHTRSGQPCPAPMRVWAASAAASKK